MLCALILPKNLNDVLSLTFWESKNTHALVSLILKLYIEA